MVCLRSRSRLLCRERVDTNSTQTSADPHRVHECLAFRIVKEPCSFSSLAPSGSHDRNAAAARNRQGPPATPHHPTATPALPRAATTIAEASVSCPLTVDSWQLTVGSKGAASRRRAPWLRRAVTANCQLPTVNCQLSTANCHLTGGAGRDRTDGLLLAKQALSQLSYSPGAVDSWQLTVGSKGAASRRRAPWLRRAVTANCQLSTDT